MAIRRVICASARAFVSPSKETRGGNPVSIFLSSGPTTSDERVVLARGCSWESVVVENGADGGSPPRFHFYMPSGEEVSFCGHAAIGACSFLRNKTAMLAHKDDLRSMNNNLSLKSSKEVVSFFTAVDSEKYEATVRGNEVTLVMDAVHSETQCNSKLCSLGDLLAEMGLQSTDVYRQKCDGDASWPTFINSSVARPKTLVPIASVERLHAATPPRNPTRFRDMCDAIDSTGVYLYAAFVGGEMKQARSDLYNNHFALETRQFPRASGYPEDPATGIAAGALAASLRKRQITINDRGEYDVSQGSSMGLPSKISVRVDDSASKKDSDPRLNISYTGLVAFDALSYSDLP